MTAAAACTGRMGERRGLFERTPGEPCQHARICCDVCGHRANRPRDLRFSPDGTQGTCANGCRWTPCTERIER